jgi:hypothetical protein
MPAIPSTWEVEAKDHKFKVSPGTVKPYLKNKI